METRAQGRIFYGWVVVAVLATTMAASSGTRFGLGVLFKPMLEEYGWSRSTLSLVAAMNVMLAGLLQPLAGWLVDRYGAKRVAFFGLAFTAAAMLLTSFARELWQLLLVYGLVGAFGFAAASPIISTAVVANWFSRRRGLAMSVAATGVALGQLIVVPLLALIQIHADWQTSFRFLALLIAILAIPLWLRFMRNRPQEMGLAAETASQGRAADAETYTYPLQACRTGLFWQLAFGFFVCGFTMAFAATHFVAYATDIGLSKVAAANAMGFMGAMSVLGSLALGALGDRFNHRNSLSLTYLLRGMAFLLLLNVQSVPMLFLAALVLGFSWLATIPLTATICAGAFGQRSLGTIFGLLFAVMPIGSGVGSYLGGFIFDHAGSYQPALVLNLALGFAASAVILTIRET
ncbi:MAG: MFS transporter, partial [Dehalococcoidia bacterium]